MLNLTSARLQRFAVAAAFLTSACSGGAGMQSASPGLPTDVMPPTEGPTPSGAMSPNSTTSGGFTLKDLGAVAGDINSRAFGIGPNGQAAGESDGGTTAAEATLFANGAASNINTLGASVSQGQGVNTSDQVTGFADVSAGRHAFLFGNGVMTDINNSTIFPGGSIGYGINRSGQVVGQGFTDRTLNSFHAFLYSNGQMTDIGTLGGIQATALAINDAGQIVGRSLNSQEVQHAFLFQNGKMTDLGVPAGATASSASAINSTGQIAGALNTSSAEDAAFFNGTWKNLGNFAGAEGSAATGINTAGTIVGTAFFPNQVKPFRPGKHVAFIVHDGSLMDLNKMLAGNAGYTMTDANGINDLGQIAGIATNGSGQPRAVLLTPK